MFFLLILQRNWQYSKSVFITLTIMNCYLVIGKFRAFRTPMPGDSEQREQVYLEFLNRDIVLPR